MPPPMDQIWFFSLIISISMVWLLTSLAVHNKWTLIQGDCKFAFIQAHLLENELTIIKSPASCPFSAPQTYWKLKKSSYGLRHAPRHCYKLISNILQSPEIGLKPTKHGPCIFHGTIIPGKPPLYLAQYVNGFVSYSLDNQVKHYLQTAISQNSKLNFLGRQNCSWVWNSTGLTHQKVM